MASLPGMITMAPSNEVELVHMVATAAAYNDGPSCFRCGFLLKRALHHVLFYQGVKGLIRNDT